ncbi:hypothetical protein BH24PSE2_BH24PSE2_17730 [soil metagenome]
MRSAERICLLMCAVIVAGCAVPRPGHEAQGSAAVSADARERFGRALELMEAGNDRAEPELIALARDFPTLAGPCVNLGILYAASGRLQEAEAAFERALKRNPASAAAHNGLGIVYRRTGRFAEAHKSYGRALAADPEYEPALLNRGMLNDLYLQRPEAALADYERYLSLHPGEDGDIEKWIRDLRLRIARRTARSDVR